MLPTTKDKIKNTNLRRYGKEYAIQSHDIQNKIKNILIKKYGVSNISHHADSNKKKSETLKIMQKLKMHNIYHGEIN